MDGDAVEGEQFTQLGRREGRRLGPAASDQPHMLDGAVAQLGQHGGRHVGSGERHLVVEQDAGDVDRHVADSQRDRGAHVGQRGALGVRMAGVPLDERPRRPRAGHALAGNAEAAVLRRPDGVDHGVVGRQQLGPQHIASELDQPEVAHPRVLEHRRQSAGDRLDAHVVGGDAVAQQPVRGREPVVHVDASDRRLGAQQRLAGEQPRRAGADDSDGGPVGVRHTGILPSRRPGRQRAPGPGADQSSTSSDAATSAGSGPVM